MPMYRIYNISSNHYSDWYTWWELLAELASGYNYEYTISHTINKNDLYIGHEHHYDSKFYLEGDYNHYYSTTTIYYRGTIIYDDYDRIINLSEIREGMIDYKPELTLRKKYKNLWRNDYQYYRYDPVPYTGKRHYGRYRTKVHSYRNCYINTYDSELETDSKIKIEIDSRSSNWYDDFIRNRYKSWKKQSKKSKQYM
jgi:hypothetical protein